MNSLHLFPDIARSRMRRWSPSCRKEPFHTEGLPTGSNVSTYQFRCTLAEYTHSLPAISNCQYNPRPAYQPSQSVSTTRTQLTSHLKLSVQPAPSLPAISNCQYNPHTACVQALISNPVFSSTDALCVSFSLK